MKIQAPGFLQKLAPDQILLAVLAINAFLINTLGTLQGFLKPIAILGGVFLATTTAWAFYSFGKDLQKDSGRNYFWAWVAVAAVQAFWAFFRAPLDVDGIFYHLTIILEALQNNKWGDWAFQIWQIQSTPKMGELPNLNLISLGGYRLAQFGHFSTVILGTLAVVRIARACKFKQPTLFGLAFFLTPIVIKQMSANYVDVAVASYWLAAAALLTHSLKWSTIAIFLLVGTKMNGLLLAVALFPIVYYQFKSGKLKLGDPSWLWGMTSLGLATWMVPNLIRFKNPVFPLQPRGLIPGSGVKTLPDDIPVDVLHGLVDTFPVALPIKWFLSFFALEPTAQYDNVGGAWGFLGAWAIIALVSHALLNYKALKIPKKLKLPQKFKLEHAIWAAIFLSFVLNPGRWTPRYGMLVGFLFLFPAMKLMLENKLSPSVKQLFVFCFILQIPYVCAERVLLRGVKTPAEAPRIVWQNFKDVLRYGEPQSPGRWMHQPYVPWLRRQEPRVVKVGAACVDLTALYWGRKFKNTVRATPGCCRWPFPCGPAANLTPSGSPFITGK